MNMLKFYKQALAILMVSFLFVGCSSKSKNTTANGTNNPTSQDDNGTNNQDDNATNNAGNVGPAGADQNVTVGSEFTVTGTSTLDGELTYEWSEDGVTLGNEQAYTGTLDKGEHILTLTVTNTAGESETDTVSIKVGKYVVSKETITDCRGNVTVKEYAYNDKGELISIKEYREGDTATPYATNTYTYDENGTPTSRTTTNKDGSTTTTNLFTTSRIDNRDSDGTGSIVTADELGTTRTFTYENGILTTGSAEYKNGTVKLYVYELNEGRIMRETVTITDSSGTYTEIIEYTYDAEGNRSTEGVTAETCATTTVKEERFIWKY